MARVIQIILTSRCAGKGTDTDPYKSMTQFFSLNGNLLFELGPEDHWRIENFKQYVGWKEKDDK